MARRGKFEDYAISWEERLLTKAAGDPFSHSAVPDLPQSLFKEPS